MLKNGDSYEGFFENGKKIGFGKYVWAETGDTYEGEWLSDIIQGKGKYEWKKTGNIYEGDIVAGQRTGNGKLVWNTKSSKGNEYVGQWLNGKMTGKGIYYNFILNKTIINFSTLIKKLRKVFLCRRRTSIRGLVVGRHETWSW